MTNTLVHGLSATRNRALLLGLKLIGAALRRTDVHVVAVERFGFTFEITRSRA